MQQDGRGEYPQNEWSSPGAFRGCGLVPASAPANLQSEIYNFFATTNDVLLTGEQLLGTNCRAAESEDTTGLFSALEFLRFRL
jgi:hypothetical protein